MIRVLLADDQTLLRQGLRIILSAEPDLQVVGEAKDGAEALSLAQTLRPDVVLMDIRMPGIDGVKAARRLRQENPENGPRVILLTTYDEDELVLRGMRAGASGYLLKDQPAEEIIAAIRAVNAGQALFRTSGAARALARLLDQPEQPPPSHAPTAAPGPADLGHLTGREVEVLRLIADGLSNHEIAERLVISEATVKTHVNNLFGKLGLQDRAQAVAYAFRAGLARS